MKLLLAALAAQAAAQSGPAPLEPAGPWTVESTDAMCLVGRKFAAGGQELTLGFRKVPASGKIRVAVWVQDPSTKPASGSAELRLDQGSPVSASFFKGEVNVPGLQLIAIDARTDQLPALAASKTLHVVAGEFVQTFHLRGIDGAVKALGDCENKLLVSWGVDPKAIESIKTPAKITGNPLSLFSTNDYPSEAIARNEQGISAVRLVVGVDGRPLNCGVVETSGSKALDTKTCYIHMRRVRYEPARTEAGEAVPSVVFQRMAWSLPK
jgi:TonB family protein